MAPRWNTAIRQNDATCVRRSDQRTIADNNGQSILVPCEIDELGAVFPSNDGLPRESSGFERQTMTSNPLPSDTLDAPTAALYCGLATATLAKLRCRGGSMPFMRLGRKIVYRCADLDTWLDARRVRNTIEGDKLPRRLTDEPRAA